ncbi:MAG: hypothetical protein O3A47_07030 [Chloroflexi bacterium]|nr:hypothetical protein [Chloroflexota bacterium]
MGKLLAVVVLAALVGAGLLGCGGHGDAKAQEVVAGRLPPPVPAGDETVGPSQNSPFGGDERQIPPSQVPAVSTATVSPTQVGGMSEAPVVVETAVVTSVRPEAEAPAVEIVYGYGVFVPSRVNIEVGQEVVFFNESGKDFWPASAIHPTHQIYPELDARSPVKSGQSWIFKFDEPGYWRYHDHLAPQNTGLVVVQGQPTVRDRPEVPGREDLSFEEPGALSVQDAVNLFKDDGLLERYILKYGPANVVKLLADYESRIGGDCHQRAHVMGRIAYQYFGSLAFSLSGHECHSGGYHGATEAFFRDRGTGSLSSDIALVCGDELNQFFRHQCVHGVGHGLMAWTSYELHDALELCDLLESLGDRLSCYSGVFMENVVGGLSASMGHVTEYLSDDPHFPCSVVAENYVSACYFYQTSRMVQVFGGDFRKVAEACSEAPATAHLVCFQSMGRDVGGFTRGNPEGAIQKCSYAKEGDDRLNCLEGAVQDSFWDVAGADLALEFCSLLQDTDEKARCYRVIVGRAGQIFQAPSELSDFCARVDESYRSGCG